MRLLCPIVALAVLTAVPLAAKPDGDVLPVAFVPGTTDQIEVFPRGNGAADLSYCAAGTFADRKGVKGTTRLVVARPLGPSATRRNQSSVIFQLTDQPPQRRVQLLSIFRPGANVSVAHARFQCGRSKRQSDD